MTRAIFVLIVSLSIISAKSFCHKYPKLVAGDGGDPGSPLFLTPFIESGNIIEGRRLASVPFFTENLPIKSYAGFFTVNKTYDSNQFFWYFPAILPNNTDAPVIVWLQGGPGGSSLFGLFSENGPLQVRNGTFESREYNWALNHHIIFIDNPVGTGFSFTNNEKGYCNDENQVGEDLYSTITQFFQLFPELQGNKFFLTGESYAGKYIPALAYTIHKKNPSATVKINLKGLAIGNGWSDPEHQLAYGKYLKQIGLIDWNQANVLEEHEKEVKEYIRHQNWEKATDALDTLMNSIANMTELYDFYNYLHTKNYTGPEYYEPMLQKSYVRKAIHVGNLTFHDYNTHVADHLMQDITKSVAPLLSELLDHYFVLTYNGQLDTLVAYPLTVNYLRNLNFSGSEEYKTAERYKWEVDGEVAGYAKQAGKLVEVLVRDAGHMVPLDQPKWALDLITRFTHEKTFHNPSYI